MLGRLVVATVLLGGMLLLLGTTRLSFASFTPTFLQSLIAATFGASLLFAFTLPRVRHLARFAVVQLGWDLAMTTGLVVVTGGAASGFTFLYGVVVLMAAIVLGGRAVVGTTVAALVIYGTAGVSLANGWLPHPPDQLAIHYRLTASDLGTSMLSNLVGLLLVGLLAGNLSTRLKRTGGQLLQAEQSVRSLARLNDHIVRSIASGLVTTASDGTVQTVNPAAADMFRSAPEDLVGRPVGDLLPIAAGEPPMPADSQGGRRQDGTATCPDGTRFPVGYSQAPLVDSDGITIGRLITFQDLTEIRELRATAERAERLAALGQLAASLAHEIRNPLSSISGSVQLVRDTASVEAEDRRLLGIVLSEVDRLNDLVSTMLQVGRPKVPQSRTTDVGALAADVVEMANRGPAQAADVTMQLQPPSAPVLAEVDPDLMRQVLWNLIKNAIQASAQGDGVFVRVRDEGDQVVLEVRDHGKGIAPEEMEHLFDMFYSRRPAGVGLGLALVKQIVDDHAGRVQVDSTPGQGTTFEVWLPR
jgi:two-component system, NtrC family, sensor histidine kinase PilS